MVSLQDSRSTASGTGLSLGLRFTEHVLGKDNSLPQYWTLLLGAYQMLPDVNAKSAYKTSGPSGGHLSLFLPRSVTQCLWPEPGPLNPGALTMRPPCIPAMILYNY